MRATKVGANAPSGRMFESNFFEFFSHIHPWQPPAIFLPLIGYLSWTGFDRGVGVLRFGLLFLAGMVMWSLLEYWLHRKLFHYVADSELGKRAFWVLHGVHHDWPNDRLRLVFPPTISLPLAAFFFWLFTVTTGEVDRYPLEAGLASGYLAYDMIHFWVHHISPKSRAGKFLRRYHLEHHFKHGTTGFGVSSPLWDYVFGTAHPAKDSSST